MGSTFGQRVLWPNEDTYHWQIRRLYTIPGFRSAITDKLLSSVETSFGLDDPARVAAALDQLYASSIFDMVEVRFSFYQSMFPPKEYRRISEDFKMSVDRSDKPWLADPHVSSRDPTTIQLSLGQFLSVEDACHALLCRVSNIAGAELLEAEEIPIRRGVEGTLSGFRYYGRMPVAPEGSEPTGAQRNLPPTMLRGLSCVSASQERQQIADHLSTMALHWLISHEDAHRYCGHIPVVGRAGAYQRAIFEEFTLGRTDPQELAMRRAAEMEADTAATMRCVDYCFDVEFLGIITDYLPAYVTAQIYDGARRSDALGAPQRLALLRLIATGSIAAILPNSLMAEAQKLPDGHGRLPGEYPSLTCRVLNHLFVVASRAMDASLHHTDKGLGVIDPKEFLVFFYAAWTDFIEAVGVYEELVSGRGVWDIPEAMRTDEAAKTIASRLFATFMTLHGQGHQIGIRGEVPSSLFQGPAAPILEFVVERHRMLVASMETFLTWRLAANPSRQDKVLEDMAFAQRRLFDFARSFGWLVNQG